MSVQSCAELPARAVYPADASAEGVWSVGGLSAWRWTIFHIYLVYYDQ